MEVGLLLVDDRRDTIEPLIPTLEERFTVVIADSADSALRAWRADERLCTGLIDLNLSGDVSSLGAELGGFDLIAQLKTLRWPSPLAVHSAYASQEKLALAAQVGADGFVVKACHPDRLRACVSILHFWATSWAAFPALAHVATYRSVGAAGGPVAALCRALLPHVSNATPNNFDFAACMLAAAVRDLYKRELRAAPCSATPLREDALGEGFRALGVGFDHVADVLELSLHPYAQPRDDLSKPTAGRQGDDLPLESRLLRLADALDDRLADSAVDAPGLMAFARQEAECGSFDPKLISALDALFRAAPFVLARFCGMHKANTR